MGISAADRVRRWTTAFPVFALALSLTLVFAYGLRGLPPEGRVEMLWPALGAAAALGVRLRSERLPAVVAALAATSLVVLFTGSWTLPSVVCVTAVLSAAVVGLILLLRHWGVERLSRPQEVGSLAGAALIVGVVSAPVGLVLGSFAGAPLDGLSMSFAWILGCVWGVVSVTPVILSIRRPASWPLRRAPEYVIAVGVTSAAAYYNFVQVQPGEPGLLGWPYLVIVGLVWLAVRLGVSAVAPVVSVVAWMAAVSTAMGEGAFAIGATDAIGRLAVSQLFMVVVTLTVLLVAVLTDERLRATAAMRELAREDPVTGLPNRRGLQEHLEEALAGLSRSPGVVGLMFCDLDQFKQVNDTVGHHLGDELLTEVAGRLRDAARAQDTVARVGGDEFVVVCQGLASPAEAVNVGLRIQSVVRFGWAGGHHTFRPTMSVGIATTSDPHQPADELLRQADVAMYEAKAAGRDCVRAYEPAVAEDLEKTVAMQHRLRTAVERGHLVLHYQPIVRLSDQTVVGAEALVRLRGADGQLIPPNRFIPLAESTGLIGVIGTWVIRQALSDLRASHDAGRILTVSVNVSPVQLRRDGFAGWLLGEARARDVDPRWIVVEVTETALIGDDAKVASALRELHDAGVTVALDDFGSGFSSLTWLVKFPVDMLKIDRSFLSEMRDEQRRAAVLAAMLAVARELSLTVVAEGVETPEQRARLIELDCPLGQGFLLGRPGPAEAGTLGDIVVDSELRIVTAPGSRPAS